MTTTTDDLRLGVVGAGRGGGFIAAARALDRVRLSAVYDPDPAAATAFRDEHGFGVTCDSYSELLERVDVVVVASPQHHHAPQAIEALGAGVHVLSEVPAAVDLEQAHALLGAVRTSTAQYMLAENYVYMRPNLILGEMVRSGALGTVYAADGEYLHAVPDLLTRPDGSPTWRRYWQAGRDALTYPTHSLGPVLGWLDDRLTSISCVGAGRNNFPEYEIQDMVSLTGRTAGGALVRVRLDILSPRPELMDYYSVQGTSGAYEAGRAEGEACRVHVGGRTAENCWDDLETYAEEFLPDRFRQPLDSTGHGGSDTWPLREFVRAVRLGERPPIDVYRALDMTLPGIVSETSIATGGAVVPVPDPRRWTDGLGSEPGGEAPLA